MLDETLKGGVMFRIASSGRLFVMVTLSCVLLCPMVQAQQVDNASPSFVSVGGDRILLKDRSTQRLNRHFRAPAPQRSVKTHGNAEKPPGQTRRPQQITRKKHAVFGRKTFKRYKYHAFKPKTGLRRKLR